MATPRSRLSTVLLCVSLVWVTSGCTSQPGEAGAAHRESSAVRTPDTEKPGPDGYLQSVTGLGINANVHNWKNGELRPAIDQIASMGDVTWRVIIDKADWERLPNPIPPPRIDWSYYNSIYSSGKMADLWATVAYINSKPGQQVMINVMGGVPEWMGGSRIDSDAEDQWVRMISSMIAYGRNERKLNFRLVSPMNETDHDGIEGPKVPPEQYVRLLHKLLDSLDSMGLSDIRLVGPDTASPEEATSSYLQAMDADRRVMSRVEDLGIHSYDGDFARASEAIAHTSAPGTKIWVTEFSGPCPSCDSGEPNPADWGAAAGAAAIAMRLLNSGASGLQFYDAWDGYYEHHQSMGYWGLLAYDERRGGYSPRKTFFVMKQLIRFVPRGSLMLPVKLDNADVSAVAFVHPATGRLTIFGLNKSQTKASAEFSLPNIVANGKLEEYITDSGHDMIAGAGANLSEGSVNATVPASSVFTFTGTIRQINRG